MVNTRNSHFLKVVARLKPGVAVEAADREMKWIAAQLTARVSRHQSRCGAVVVSVREDVLGDTRVELLVLMIAAASIVLIACANLASLLLSRAWARRGEYAVRLSLGATRSRLVRQIVTEASVSLGDRWRAGPGDSVADWQMIERLVPVGLHRPRRSSTGGSWPSRQRLSIATGLLFSLGPALQSSRASTAEALQQHARGAVGTGTTGLFRDGLVVLQVAATVVLLVAAGLMLRTLANLRAIELGFTPDRLLTMQVSLPQPKYADETKRSAFFDRVVAGVRAQPGVEGAAFGSTLPFQSIGNTNWFTIEGRSEVPGEIRDALFRVGTSGYLKTLGAVAPRAA